MAFRSRERSIAAKLRYPAEPLEQLLTWVRQTFSVQGQVFPIVDKPDVGQRWVRIDDFVLGEAQPIDVDVVARSPRLSLYCIDFDDQTAVFVETAHDAPLCDAVFMFEVQRSAAQRVVKIPL